MSEPTRPPLPCPYRGPARPAAGGERADCGLLRQITGLGEGEWCAVRRDACEACCEQLVPSPTELNTVVASLLYDLTGRILGHRGAGGCDAAQAAELQRWSELSLARADEDDTVVTVTSPPPAPPPGRPPLCDVVVYCPDAGADTDRATQSALDQWGVEPQVHLVGDGAARLERYRGRGNVVTHTTQGRPGLFEALHGLVPHLRSEYVAVQDAGTVSRPHRLRDAVGLLAAHGADLLAAAVQTPGGVVAPERPAGGFRRCVPPEALVFRRAALVDLGGIADRDGDADAELVYRAAREGRSILLCQDVAVDRLRPSPPAPIGPAPRYAPREGTLRHHAKGFPEQAVACDVVLPFHGHLDYVRAAVESLLDQDGAEAVVHLVDDASPEDTEGFLRSWKTDRRVRTYRNEHNLGQFTSANNVVPFLETGLLAVQDADDLSLPRRLHRAGNALRLAGADVFGGRSWVFDDGWWGRTAGTGLRERLGLRRDPYYRNSRYPGRRSWYFLENPTAVIRAGAFADLGGFADFGDPLRNRCSVDTEFYLRAHHGGLRFAVTRDVVLWYRHHPDSATSHPATRRGSPPRSWAEAECRRRAAVFRGGAFDPRAFGGLGRYRGLTRRV